MQPPTPLSILQKCEDPVSVEETQPIIDDCITYLAEVLTEHSDKLFYKAGETLLVNHARLPHRSQVSYYIVMNVVARFAAAGWRITFESNNLNFVFRSFLE